MRKLDPSEARPPSRLQDTADGYGWISIGLHWGAAVAVVVLLVAGSQIHAGQGDYGVRRDLHTAIAVCAYLLLWARVLWRFAKGHPGPLPKQGRLSFAAAKPVHWLMVIALAAMLVSGPLMAWSAGLPIHVFALAIPGPYPASEALWRLTHAVHVIGASIIAASLALHVAAVAANAAIKRDGGFDKIMIAAKPAPTVETGKDG